MMKNHSDCNRRELLAWWNQHPFILFVTVHSCSKHIWSLYNHPVHIHPTTFPACIKAKSGKLNKDSWPSSYTRRRANEVPSLIKNNVYTSVEYKNEYFQGTSCKCTNTSFICLHVKNYKFSIWSSCIYNHVLNKSTSNTDSQIQYSDKRKRCICIVNCYISIFENTI